MKPNTTPSPPRFIYGSATQAGYGDFPSIQEDTEHA